VEGLSHAAVPVRDILCANPGYLRSAKEDNWCITFAFVRHAPEVLPRSGLAEHLGWPGVRSKESQQQQE
jgi:hypothetical protein